MRENDPEIMKIHLSTVSVLFVLIVGVNSGLLKDVVHLPSESEQKENTPIKKSLSTSMSTTPMAWIAGDINKKPLKQITLCLWIKSLDQGGTGTIISYNTDKEKIEFGLVGIDKKNSQKETVTNSKNHNVYVVIKGTRSRIPIPVKLDDVRWHHVCVTWSSRLGIWRFYMDGKRIKQAIGMKRGRYLDPGGQYYLGGGASRWMKESSFVNGSDDSRTVIRVSAGFRPVRKKRALYSTQIQRFVGKITDLYIWGKSLTPNHIKEIYNCSDEFREKLNDHILTRTKESFRFARRRARRKSWLPWATNNVIYAWDVTTISLQRPAGLIHSGTLCGYPINVECGTGSILVSMSRNISQWYKTDASQIHLNEYRCTPVVRGDYLVFHLPDMKSCGTKRKVIDRNIVYTNTISNTPFLSTVFVGHLFKAEVKCKFPMDVKASMKQVIKGKTPELIGKTSNIKNPKTNKPDLEAVFLLFEDDKFSKSFHEKEVIGPSNKVFGGILIKGIKHEDEAEEEDVNVVVDKCWMDLPGQNPLVDRCGDSSSRILENGKGSQVRMQLPTEDLVRMSPDYIQCSIYPCVGSQCESSCPKSSNKTQDLEMFGQTRSRKQRDITNGTEEEQEMYVIRIGPMTYEFVSSEDYSTPDPDNQKDSSSYATAVSCVAVIALLAIGASMSVLLVLRKTRRVNSSGDWDAIEGARKSKHRPIRVHSFTFCRPTRTVYTVYPPSYHAVARAHFHTMKNEQTM